MQQQAEHTKTQRATDSKTRAPLSANQPYHRERTGGPWLRRHSAHRDARFLHADGPARSRELPQDRPEPGARRISHSLCAIALLKTLSHDAG